MRTFVAIDMQCLKCSHEFPIPEELMSGVIDRSPRGNLEFYKTEESTEPIEHVCLNCKTSSTIWKEGIMGRNANSSPNRTLIIGGDVTNSNIRM